MFTYRDSLSGTVEVDETLVGGKQAENEEEGKKGKHSLLLLLKDRKKEQEGSDCQKYLLHQKKHWQNLLMKTLKKEVRYITNGWKGYNLFFKNGYQHIIEDNTKMIDS